nr:hypothetical protein [Nocardia asiatica]
MVEPDRLVDIVESSFDLAPSPGHRLLEVLPFPDRRVRHGFTGGSDRVQPGRRDSASQMAGALSQPHGLAAGRSVGGQERQAGERIGEQFVVVGLLGHQHRFDVAPPRDSGSPSVQAEPTGAASKTARLGQQAQAGVSAVPTVVEQAASRTVLTKREFGDVAAAEVIVVIPHALRQCLKVGDMAGPDLRRHRRCRCACGHSGDCCCQAELSAVHVVGSFSPVFDGPRINRSQQDWKQCRARHTQRVGGSDQFADVEDGPHFSAFHPARVGAVPVQESTEVGLGQAHFSADEGKGLTGPPFGEQLAESRRLPRAVHLVLGHFRPPVPELAVLQEL